MTEALTKVGILAHKDIETVKVEVPEWGGHFWFQSFNGKDRDRFEEFITAKQPKKGQRNKETDFRGVKVLAIIKSAVDAEVDGQFIFTEADVPGLNKKSAKVINRLWDLFCKMNGFGDDDVEDMMGNSEGETNDISGSNSPETLEVAP